MNTEFYCSAYVEGGEEYLDIEIHLEEGMGWKGSMPREMFEDYLEVITNQLKRFNDGTAVVIEPGEYIRHPHDTGVVWRTLETK